MDFPISVPSIGLVDGKFVDEDPLLGRPGSLIPSSWGNSITLEVLNVIEAAGLAPSEEDLTQLLQAIRLINQAATTTFGVDTGAANVYTVAYTPAISALSNGVPLRFKAKTANNGASTFSQNGGPAKALVGLGLAALQGGEIVADGICTVVYSATLDKAILLSCTGGALAIAPGIKSQHALQLGQVSGIVGQARNARMYMSAASASGTFTADEVIVETALGGLRYCVSGVNKIINLVSAGAGGMDTGAAPASGFVGIYLIYNPVLAVSALLAVNANAAIGHVYGGANMPAGYTASGLIAVLPTNASSQFLPAFLRDRKVSFAARSAISTATQAVTPTALSISALVPPNAISITGVMGLNSSAASNLVGVVYMDAVNSMGGSSISALSNSIGGPFEVDLPLAQTMYYTLTSSTGTASFGITISAYRF